MNTNDQSPRSKSDSTAVFDKDSTKVTPEAARSFVKVDLLSEDIQESGRVLPFLSFSEPVFSGLGHREPRPFLRCNTDAARRSADQLRALPRRKIALRRRVPSAETGRSAQERVGPTFLSTPATIKATSDEIIALCATPLPPLRKRQRLSPPPALPHGANDCHEPFHFTASTTSLSTSFSLPSNL